MNQYVDKKYYTDTFQGKTIPESDVEKYLMLAQEKIDSITYNRIVAIGFDNLTEFQQDCVRKAICYQAEHYSENGIESSSVSSYSVLDISVNIDNTKQTEAQKQDMNEFAYINIVKSGLASRLL